VVDRALARRAVILVACRKRGGVKRAHSGVLARGERRYVLAGTRAPPWQHSIPPTKELRYSVTFRTLR
jgi:hypothetical protein